MKPSFLTYEKPLLTCMLQADTPDRIQELFQKASSNGAEAYGMQFCRLKPEFRTKDIYRSLFHLPIPPRLMLPITASVKM